MQKSFPHQFYKDCQLTFALFMNVENAKELRQGVMKGEFEATLLKTCMISGYFQVIAAANKAVHLSKTEKMTTKNVHSEVLFCLSPTKNISDSFRKFGMGDADTAVFVVIINDRDDTVLGEIRKRIKGTELPVEDCGNLADTDLIKKVFKVTDLELTSCCLEDALVSRIASKEFVTI